MVMGPLGGRKDFFILKQIRQGHVGARQKPFDIAAVYIQMRAQGVQRFLRQGSIGDDVREETCLFGQRCGVQDILDPDGRFIKSPGNSCRLAIPG
jgi:hypothetical protein